MHDVVIFSYDVHTLFWWWWGGGGGGTTTYCVTHPLILNHGAVSHVPAPGMHHSLELVKGYSDILQRFRYTCIIRNIILILYQTKKAQDKQFKNAWCMYNLLTVIFYSEV